MRTIWRTLRADPVTKPALLVGLAIACVGVAYGAMSTSSGHPWWFAPVLAITVVAGASEMLFVGLMNTGVHPFAAVFAGLLVNLRHVPYSLALRDAVGRDLWRLLRIHGMNDEAVALALSEPTPDRSRRALMIGGVAVIIFWPLGALTGSLLGRIVDPTTLGLDALFPAVLLAILFPAFRQARTRGPLLAGIAISLGAGVLLGPGLPPLLGLLATPLLLRKAPA